MGTVGLKGNVDKTLLNPFGQVGGHFGQAV